MTSEKQERRSSSDVEINGDWYAIPTLDDLTIDEEHLLYVYADAVIADFTPPHPSMSKEEQAAEWAAMMRKVRNPEFKRALAHIAFKRRYPDVKDEEIRVTVGGANALAVDLAMLGRDDSPPAESSQKQPESESDTSPLSSSSDSGSRTTPASDPGVVSLARTGTIGSGTSSPESLATTSAGS